MPGIRIPILKHTNMNMTFFGVGLGNSEEDLTQIKQDKEMILQKEIFCLNLIQRISGKKTMSD